MPTRRTPALIPDERTLGLRRAVVRTSLGPIVTRVGRETTTTTPAEATPTDAQDRTATILLHGAAGSWSTWTPLVAASDQTTAPLHDVIIPDLPGWGESGGLPSIDAVGRVSDAIADLADALGYSSWRLIGHSLGGVIALDIAARHPDRTRGVALVSPSGAAVLAAVRRPLRGGLRLPSFAGMLLAMRVLSIIGRRGRGGRALMRRLDDLGVLRRLATPLFGLPAAIHHSVITAIAHDARPDTFRRAAILAAAYDMRAWRRIACPVGSVRGEKDVFAGAPDADAFAGLIPGFREVRLADAGHFAHVERPAETLAVISALAGLRRPTPPVARADSPPSRDAAASVDAHLGARAAA